MKISNLSSRHLGLFSRGLAYDFGFKFQISSKFVNGEIDPENYVLAMFSSEIKVILTIFE